MLGQGKELAALDFAHIIGGPLVAVVNAQAMAARVTTDFIQNIAFDNTGAGAAGGSSTKLKTVAFDFTQVIGQAGGKLTGVQDATTIKVPLLTLVPIPYIRVDSMTIDLNVNLHDTSTVSLSNDFAFSSSTSGSESSFFGLGPSISFAVSVSDRNTYQQDQTVDDTYSLHVTVHAVQDQMPGGMGQILNIFSNVIQQQATLLQTIMSAQIAATQANVQKALGTTPGGK